MSRFDNRDVAFDVPDGWEDRTVVAFESPRAAGAKFATNVTLSRVDGKPTMSLLAYGTQQVASLARNLPNFELVSQRSITFGGLPAIELLFHWRADDQGLTQRITMFERRGAVWSFAASALRETFEANLPGFERIAKSLKFVGDPSPSAGGGGFGPPSQRGGGDGGGGLERPRGW